MKNVCVFCGANAGRNPIYAETTRQLAAKLAQRGDRIVYGGGCVGLMGVLADEMLRCGGYVVGVVPKFLKDHEVAHEGIQELLVTESMHERKAIMADRSDVVVALPGGFGSLDELFEILTWKQLHLHQKPVILLNTLGFYDHLLQLLNHMVTEGFLKSHNMGLLQVASSIEQLLEIVDSYEPPQLTGKWIDQQIV